MGRWDNATAEAAWTQAGWRRSGWTQTRKSATPDQPSRPLATGGWTSGDIAVLLVLLWSRWELGLAFVALKLWHQVSREPGSTFSFARRKWDLLVEKTRGLVAGSSLPVTMRFGERSSDNLAFDAWRREELARIDAAREKLRGAEHDFARYRVELMRAMDREHFDRFMQTRI